MAENNCKTVLLNMEQHRREQLYTDTVLECTDGPVHAHKSILMASSLYFYKMFTTDMLEKTRGRAKFPTISKDMMEIVVTYLYTAQIPQLSQDSVFFRELIQTGHMLELNDLIVKCWQRKTDDLTVENFADIWPIGVDFDLCKHGSIQNFFTNNLTTISESKNVQILRDVDVIKIIECVDPKFHSDCIELVLNWKSVDRAREEAAGKMLGKIDLKSIEDLTLQDLMRVAWTKKKETVENILIRECLNRLIRIFLRNGVEKSIDRELKHFNESERLEAIEKVEKEVLRHPALLLK